MTRAVVNPGICGMTATIGVAKVSKRIVRVEINSDCEKVIKMSKSLPTLSLSDALKPQVDSVVYKYASEHHLCASCPMPMAILKVVEVENGIALPSPVFLHFEATDPE